MGSAGEHRWYKLGWGSEGWAPTPGKLRATECSVTRGGRGGASPADTGFGVTSLPSEQLCRSKTSKTHTSQTLKVGVGGISLCLRRWSCSLDMFGIWAWWWGEGVGRSQRGVQERGQRASFIELAPSAEVPPSWSTLSAPKTDAWGPAARSILPLSRHRALHSPALGHREMCTLAVLTRAAPGDKAEGTRRRLPAATALGPRDNVHMSNQVLKRYTDTKERHF